MPEFAVHGYLLVLISRKNNNQRTDSSSGPDYGTASGCIFVGMVTDELNISKLVNTIAALGREIEENGKVTTTNFIVIA